MRALSSGLALLIVALTSMFGAVPARAQRVDDTPQNGVRVRITVNNGPRITGTLARLTADSVFFSTGDKDAQLRTMSRDNIVQLEAKVGRSKFTGAMHGIAFGALAGGALGALIGSREGKPQYVDKAFPSCDIFSGVCHGSFTIRVCDKNCGHMGATANAFAMAIIGIPVGAIGGAIVGADKWTILH